MARIRLSSGLVCPGSNGGESLILLLKTRRAAISRAFRIRRRSRETSILSGVLREKTRKKLFYLEVVQRRRRNLSTELVNPFEVDSRRYRKSPVPILLRSSAFLFSLDRPSELSSATLSSSFSTLPSQPCNS